MRLILLALLLTACQRPDPQFQDFEAKGYERQAYTEGMRIVPCLRWENDDPLTGKAHRMTAGERMDWQRAKGGYLSDCGEYNEESVWG